VYGTLDMPPYGDPDNPVHHHVAPHYLEESEHEIDIPNVVTSVLASYRGYDTMGETTVIFTAMVGVLLLMGGIPRREASADGAEGEGPAAPGGRSGGPGAAGGAGEGPIAGGGAGDAHGG